MEVQHPWLERRLQAFYRAHVGGRRHCCGPAGAAAARQARPAPAPQPPCSRPAPAAQPRPPPPPPAGRARRARPRRLHPRRLPAAGAVPRRPLALPAADRPAAPVGLAQQPGSAGEGALRGVLWTLLQSGAADPVHHASLRLALHLGQRAAGRGDGGQHRAAVRDAGRGGRDRGAAGGCAAGAAGAGDGAWGCGRAEACRLFCQAGVAVAHCCTPCAPGPVAPAAQASPPAPCGCRTSASSPLAARAPPRACCSTGRWTPTSTGGAVLLAALLAVLLAALLAVLLAALLAALVGAWGQQLAPVAQAAALPGCAPAAGSRAAAPPQARAGQGRAADARLLLWPLVHAVQVGGAPPGLPQPCLARRLPAPAVW
jgi:hypothetical protein